MDPEATYYTEIGRLQALISELCDLMYSISIAAKQFENVKCDVAIIRT